MSTTAPPPTTTPAGVTARQRSVPARSFGPLLLRLHFYAGIFVAPFLLVAALTGLLYAFMPQIERAYYGDVLVVDNPGGPSTALADQISAARALRPGEDLVAVRPGMDGTTTQIDFASTSLDDEHFHTVYVNPSTGAVTGQLTTWFATTPLKTWFDDLHRNLHLGATGRYYSEFAASWLAILALGGLALWWRRQRSVRKTIKPELSANKGVRRTRSWHAATGVWLTLGLLLLSATGLTWSRYAGANFGEALDRFRGSTPYVSTDLGSAAAPTPSGGHHGGGGVTAAAGSVDPAAVDRVLKIARDDGIDGPVEIAVPADTATAWTVTQTRNLWPVGRDSVAVDATAGKVTERIDFADWPLFAKLTRWGINAHMGTLFGLVNQVLLAALALGLICVIVWGYRMWWQRRPTRADRKALVGAPPVGRGAWQQLPSWGIVVGVPLVIALGWFVPLFGVPLAVFLLADLTVGAFRGHRGRTPEVPVSPAPAGG